VHVTVYVQLQWLICTGTLNRSGVCLLAIIMTYRDGHSATMQIAYMKLTARLGQSAKQVYKELLGVYLPQMPIRTCVRRFYNGRDMFKGYHRSRRPKSEMDSNIIAAINALVEEDTTNKVHVLVETFGISSGVVFQIVRQ
jgi:hypothetical protein